MHSECLEFFTHPNTPTEVPATVEEIRIHNSTTGENIYCHSQTNPEAKDFGWCHTEGNYYNWNNISFTYRGWGYCSQDCYLDLKASNRELRVKEKVNILSADLCEEFLKTTLFHNVTVKPEVLCVAHQESFKESVWYKTDSGYQERRDALMAKRFGKTGYVASPGVCAGDSGGPVFIEQDGQFVVTGFYNNFHLACSFIY